MAADTLVAVVTPKCPSIPVLGGVICSTRYADDMVCASLDGLQKQVAIHTKQTLAYSVTFWRHYKSSPFACSTVDYLHNVNKLLLVVHGPIYLVVISSAQINHDVLIPEEKHDRARVIQFVHSVEIRDF